MKQRDEKTDRREQPRRKYEKPGFITSLTFERQALSCAGCLNASPDFPAFCALQS